MNDVAALQNIINTITHDLVSFQIQLLKKAWIFAFTAPLDIFDVSKNDEKTRMAKLALFLTASRMESTRFARFSRIISDSFSAQEMELPSLLTDM
jgi:hypothetical protein